MEKDDNLNLTLFIPIWKLAAKKMNINSFNTFSKLINAASLFLFAIMQKTKQTYHEVISSYLLKCTDKKLTEIGDSLFHD